MTAEGGGIFERLDESGRDIFDGWSAGDPVRGGLAACRVHAPVRPSKIVCVGLNYRDHAAEMKKPLPDEPMLFLKPSTSVLDPGAAIRLPPGVGAVHHEAELAVVIGTRAKYVSEAEALDHVAGYAVCNDVSEREYQIERSNGQWDKGKSCETFNPCGPWLATADELGDILELEMWLDVNGVRRQTGSTATMIFDPFFLVHYLSQFMVLEPGDLISTGTPPGVGMGMKPPTYLAAGDVMELGIAGLGTQRQDVIDAP